MDNRFLDFQGGSQRRTTPVIHKSYEEKPRARRAAISAPKSMVGHLVQHAEMGRGVVIEDNGDIVTVAFKSRGIKKVARQYLEFDA